MGTRMLRGSSLRRESKYLLAQSDYLSLRKQLYALLQVDPHGQDVSGYSVYSLYFDTKDLSLLSQSIEGENRRSKFRIRFYSLNADVCFAEIKCRDGQDSWKHRLQLPVSPNTLLESLQRGISIADLIPESTEAQGYNHYLSSCRLDPKVFVGFKREAFFVNELPSVRITLDRDLFGLRFQDLIRFDVLTDRELTCDSSQNVLLELKFENKIPSWLNQLLSGLTCKKISFSKYSTVARQLHSHKTIGVYSL